MALRHFSLRTWDSIKLHYICKEENQSRTNTWFEVGATKPARGITALCDITKGGLAVLPGFTKKWRIGKGRSVFPFSWQAHVCCEKAFFSANVASYCLSHLHAETSVNAIQCVYWPKMGTKEFHKNKVLIIRETLLGLVKVFGASRK